MHTGISTACFYGRMYNEDALKKIGELGAKRAEIFFSGLTEYRDEYVEEFRRVLDGEGVELVSVHAFPTQFEPQLFSAHGRQYKEALGIYEDVLRAAQKLGAGVYVFHGPIHLKVARTLRLDMAFVGERVTVLAELAKQYGVALCYENVHWCWFKSPDFAGDILRATESDNLYFTLDMKQAAQSGCSFMDYIDAMGSRLKHVHVCDYRTDKKRGIIPCLPFTGETDWEALRGKLREIGYRGTLMMEVYSNNYDTFAQLQENFDAVTRFFAEP